jgi:hypothetical protein
MKSSVLDSLNDILPNPVIIWQAISFPEEHSTDVATNQNLMAMSLKVHP